MKYRGKHTINDHRWYCGEVIYHIHDAYIIGPSFDKGEYFSVKVIPTTVAKCIDYVDVNGVDIYEGDIINILQYDTYASEQSEQSEQYEAFYAVETKHGFLAKLTKSNYSRVEVVGNKWDNPELLELCKEVI